MRHSYETKNTCSSKITFDLDGDIVHNIKFTDGCSANLQVISNLVDGMTINQLEEKCKGVVCGRRKTSCADQLAVAARQAYDGENNDTYEIEEGRAE